MNTKLDFMKEFKRMNDCTKMDYYTMKTVKQLREIAKVNGMRGYSGLRKADLAALISSRTTQSIITGQGNNVVDSPVPHAHVPISTPSTLWGRISKQAKAVVSIFTEKGKNVINKFIDKTKATVSTCVDKTKAAVSTCADKAKAAVRKLADVVNTKINSIFSKPSKTDKPSNKKTFEIRETATAIKGFTKRHTIEGTDGIDAESFLNAVRPE